LPPKKNPVKKSRETEEKKRSTKGTRAQMPVIVEGKLGADFYLPAVPPAALRPFTLHVLAEKRVVGAAVRRAPIQVAGGWETGMSSALVLSFLALSPSSARSSDGTFQGATPTTSI
jgi:hypothetical protein